MNQTMKTTKLAAARISNYQELDIDTLANGYCKAVDENNDLDKNSYIAALILRFWYQQRRMYTKCKGVSVLDFDDYYERLFYCIQTACEYRAWQDPAAKTTAQACINQAISSRGAAEILYQTNREKGKANINTVKLDTPIPTDDSNKTTRLDTLEDTYNTNTGDVAVSFIQSYIDRGQSLEAVILDVIAFNDTVKVETEQIQYQDIDTGEMCKAAQSEVSFWKHRAVQYLTNLPINYEKYFRGKYRIAEKELHTVIENIKKCNNQKISRYIDKTLLNAQSKSDELLM